MGPRAADQREVLDAVMAEQACATKRSVGAHPRAFSPSAAELAKIDPEDRRGRRRALEFPARAPPCKGAVRSVKNKPNVPGPSSGNHLRQPSVETVIADNFGASAWRNVRQSQRMRRRPYRGPDSPGERRGDGEHSECTEHAGREQGKQAPLQHSIGGPVELSPFRVVKMENPRSPVPEEMRHCADTRTGEKKHTWDM